MKDLNNIIHFIFIFLLQLIDLSKEDNYISAEFLMVDDCIREVDVSNRMVFGFTPANLSSCDSEYQNIYPHFFVKNEKYDFGTEIKFIFQDSWHIDGFMNITVHFNEYYINATDRLFWQCIDCGTDDKNYYYDENKKQISFYKSSDGAKNEKNYTFIFQINNFDEINNLINNNKLKVNHEYYAFTDKKIIYLKLHYTDDELELINFNSRENFHINGNRTLSFDSSKFYYHIDYINSDFSGTLSALGMNSNPLVLGDNYDFRTSNEVGIRYKLTPEEISNRAVNVSIYLTAFNNKGKQVTSKTEFIFVITLYGDESDLSENVDDTSKDTIKETSKDISEDTVKETAEGSSEETVKETAEDSSEDTVKETAEDSSEDTVKETAEDSSEDTVKETAEDSSEDTVKETSKEKEKTDEINDDSSQKTEKNHCLDEYISYDKDKDIYYYICPKYNTNEIIPNIDDIIDKIDTEKKYTIIGKDYIAKIIPIDYSDPSTNNTNNTEIFFPSSYVNFSECEKKLRNKHGILTPRKITFIQIEINNTIDDILVNQIEYQVYDDNQTILNLSLCFNETIKISYTFKDNTSDIINKINYFKGKGIDILDINDPFFNDICTSYSEDGEDLTLNDRIQEYYKNYSFCEKNCKIDSVFYNDNRVICDCSVKESINVKDSNFNIIKNTNKKSVNFQVSKCYNAFLNLKDNLFNLGFWIFLFLMILNIILLVLLCCLDIKSIKYYMQKQLAKFGYIDQGEEGYAFCHNYVKKLDRLIDRLNQMRNDFGKNKNKNTEPPKHKVHIVTEMSSNKKKLNNKIKNNNNKNKKNLETDISLLKIRMNKTKKVKLKNGINVSSFKNTKNGLSEQNSKNNFSTKDKIIFRIELDSRNNLNKNNNKNNEKPDITDKFEINLININVKELNKGIYIPYESKHILNIYEFEEAVKYDKRGIFSLYYIFLILKQVIMHAFLYKSKIEPFPLRLSLLKFIFGSDLAMNAIFYTDDKISELHRSGKNLVTFAFTNNFVVIIIALLIGYFFLILLSNINNTENQLRKIFRNEENKIKNDKKYEVSILRKKEIILEVKKIIKKFKIKVIIFYIIEFSFMLFFWYYATVFCYVYNKTQISWLINTIFTIIIRIIIDLLVNLLFASLYKVSINFKSNRLFSVIIFIYCFA